MPELSTENLSTSEGAPQLDQLDVHQQAMSAIVAAFAGGVVLALVGILLGLTREDVVTVLVLLVVCAGIAVSYLLFRAMFAAAEDADGTAMGAVTHPAFLTLFASVALLVALAIGYVYGEFLV